VTALARRGDAWLGAPAPPERLAVLRILTGLFAVAYLIVRLPAFLSLADGDRSGFEPVGVLAPLGGPLAPTAWRGLLIATLVLGVAYTAGAAFRLTGPAFAVALLAVTTYHSSWGQLLWFENVLVLHVLIVGFARSADAVSIDAAAHGRMQTDPRPVYGWPVRLAALVTVVTYVLAGVAKLRAGGAQWIVGDTLRNHVAYSAARLELLGASPSPLVRPLVGQAWLFPPLAVATVLIELCAPLALLGGPIRTAWVAAAWAMHVGIAALMFVVFPYPLFLVAFAPLYPLERLVPAARRSTEAVLPSQITPV
jgi:hypothetical protein